MSLGKLPPREREVARIVYARGEVSADDVRAALSDPLTNAAVRSMLRRLVGKGVLRRHKQGKRFLYSPALEERSVREAVLRRVSRDYFDGSLAEAALALIEMVELREPGTLRAIRPRLRRIARAGAAQMRPAIHKASSSAGAAAA